MSASDQKANASALMSATQGLLDILSPLNPDDRKRAIQAALVLLGDTTAAAKDFGESSKEEDGNDSLPLAPKAKLWMKQNGISEHDLAQVFHFDNGVAGFIAGEMPGKTAKEKTLNAYMLCGLAIFLVSGEPKFSDRHARALCTEVGCYDGTNLGKYLKAKGNNFTGTKDLGWALTAPGLKAVAKIVQQLTAAAS